MKKFSSILIGFVMLMLGVGVGRLSAGSPDAPGGPGDIAAGMYTMEQVYQRISSGGVFQAATTFTEPTTPPGTGTMHNLNQIYLLLGLSAHVRVSGQTLCYSTIGNVISCPNTGEDAELHRGAKWPVPRFTNSGNGTVTDNLTGLIWLRDANCAGGTRDWGTALSDIQTLNFSGTISGTNCLDTSNAGSFQTDWRLPNVQELQSLADYGFSLPAVPNAAGTGQWAPGDPFNNVQGTTNGAGRYWSSTTSAILPTNAWEVDLSVGTVNRNDNKSLKYYVWPVRGGQSGL